MICNKCGTAVEHNAYFCDKCGNRVRKEVRTIDKSQLKGMALWEENYLFGTLGAILGSAVGFAIFYQWFMFFSTQFLVPIPGMIMGCLTAGAYWWLGKRLKGVGTVICLVLTACFGWIANHYFWAMVVYTNGLSGAAAFETVFVQLAPYWDAGHISLIEYVLGLISIYFGCFLGVAGTAAAYKTIVKN